MGELFAQINIALVKTFYELHGFGSNLKEGLTSQLNYNIDETNSLNELHALQKKAKERFVRSDQELLKKKEKLEH